MSGWIESVLGRPRGSFARMARSRGVRPRCAATLEHAARAIAPDDPTRIFESRELFEVAATNAVVGDGGNLELSFGLVDELANLTEELGLARASDVPDPFRRVWVKNRGGQRIRGVVLTRSEGEIAVFCPPSELAIAEIGAHLWLDYRGFTSAVEYELQLDDKVRLPGALVLHLKRPSGSGAIGRSSVRYEVAIEASLRLLDEEDFRGWSDVSIEDVSAGGLALTCDESLEQGARVRIQFALSDEEAPFAAEAIVRWSRIGDDGRPTAGLAFVGLPRPRAERLDRFLRTLDGENQGSEPVGSPERVANKQEQRLVEYAFAKVCRAASFVNGRALSYRNVRASRGGTRARAEQPSVAFAFALGQPSEERVGCVQMPLSDALAIAAVYSMRTASDVEAARKFQRPDGQLSAALAQIGELVALAVERAYLRALGVPAPARALPFQLLDPGDACDFPRTKVDAYLTGRCAARLGDGAPFELLVTLPA